MAKKRKVKKPAKRPIDYFNTLLKKRSVKSIEATLDKFFKKLK